MKSTVTIKLKIPKSNLLLETMKQYSQSAQYVVNIGWDKGIYFKKELHDSTYYKIREKTNLPSQLVCSSRDKACEALKALRKVKKPSKPFFKDFLTIRYDARSFTFKQDYVSLATIQGRIKIPLKIPEYYRRYLNWNVRSVDLILDRKQRLFLYIVFSRDFNNHNSQSKKTVGVDVGINHIAVTSERQFFCGNPIKEKRLRFQRLRSKLQAKGTRSARRRLKVISGREKRFMRHWNHVISKQIVNNCKAGTIVLENIKGIRTNKGRKFNFWLHRWSFYQLQQFITYKAERRGIKVVKVNPYHSSQICSKCKQLGSRSSGFFVCSHCGYSLNADLNASYNLARHHSITDGVSAPVTVPYISGDEARRSIDNCG